VSSSSLAGSLVVTGRSASAKTPPRWQAAEVIEILEEAPDAVTLRLRLDETDGFLPGQYYNVRLGVLGESRAVQRAYSVGSSPLPDPSVIDLGGAGSARRVYLPPPGTRPRRRPTPRGTRPIRPFHLDWG
jgi:hypothetical protein